MGAVGRAKSGDQFAPQRRYIGGKCGTVDRRQRLVWSESLSLRDARGRMLFLLGAPRERQKIDCGDTFHPLEIWSYGPVESARRAVLFRPRADAFFALWRPTESKRVLYMPEMEYYLEQWEELRGLTSGKRPDRILCKSSKEVDEVTGVSGLFGFEKGRTTDAMMDAVVAPPDDQLMVRKALRAFMPDNRHAIFGPTARQQLSVFQVRRLSARGCRARRRTDGPLFKIHGRLRTVRPGHS